MNKNKIVLTYACLSLLLISSAVALAYQVRHFMYERTDPTQEFAERVKPREEIERVIEQKKADEQRGILLTFSQTQSFKSLATPVPKPTPTPRPEPSPTPVIPAKNWKVDMVLKNFAILLKYDGTSHPVKVGDILDDAAPGHGNFQILELIPDPQLPRVKVKDINTGVVGEINQQVNLPNPPNQPR